MPRTITPALRKLLSAGGRKGGHTGTKNTTPARLARLRQAGAEFDAAGQLLESPATRQARQLLADDLRVAKARKAYAKEQAQQEGR